MVNFYENMQLARSWKSAVFLRVNFKGLHYEIKPKRNEKHSNYELNDSFLIHPDIVLYYFHVISLCWCGIWIENKCQIDCSSRRVQDSRSNIEVQYLNF